MRRSRPFLAHLLAVLLLVQWGGSAAACVASMQPALGQVVCHAGAAPAGGTPGQDTPQRHDLCQLCTLAVPGLLPGAPMVVPPYAAAGWPAPLQPAAPLAVPVPRLTPQQPRAPPALA